ncbi:basic amino acid/polyamine antiporter, APA family [Actinopolyspora xinjiangensis]|uniref:Basic amino acid/polyamine antiporter, APA family n=1 Tax=Actinopolyspora xinjiangensis TaxID=405564 RepID=A0A1H0TEL5_9ACTN|nr:amino acid permease [Actinopolyspora xinjiangensis]SDP52444.1 basic amino acid/polyamine antiporter, APA family [Actinopolyspora xinjiangensis]
MTERSVGPAGSAAVLRAIPLGLGAMLGAGVFLAPAPATAIAGPWVPLAVPVAVVTAWCAALAARCQAESYRAPGAGYVCVRDKLGTVPGRIAAGTGLFGHAAAMAAVAGTAARHLPTPQSSTAVSLPLFAVLVSTAGLRIRGAAGWLWLVPPLAVVVVVITACLSITPVDSPVAPAAPTSGPLAVTGAAGVLFLAFAGFERLTTPSRGNVRLPSAAVGRALPAVLLVVGVVLTALLSAVLYQLGSARLALSPAPLLDALRAADAAALTSGVGLGVALAALPVLLAVLESARPTGTALVADGELPLLARRGGASGTPVAFDLAVAAVAASLAWFVEPELAVSVAACCLLVHYALVNAATRVLLLEGRKLPRRTACLGMGLSVVLAMSMPVPAMGITLGVAVGAPLLAVVGQRARRSGRERPREYRPGGPDTP